MAAKTHVEAKAAQNKIVFTQKEIELKLEISTSGLGLTANEEINLFSND